MSELSLNVVSNEALKMKERKKRKVKKIKRQCEIRERKGKKKSVHGDDAMKIRGLSLNLF